MTSITVIVLIAAATAIAVTWRLSARRCTCQRDEPLAGLGALGEVTTRVRQRQARGHMTEQPATRLPLQPVPFPARRGSRDLRRRPSRHALPAGPRHKGASPCP